MSRRLAAEDGVVGGLEMLAFGFLTFVVVALLLANAWGVIDAKLAATAAAREAARAFVEAPDAATAHSRAVDAARAAISGHGRDPDRMGPTDIDGAFARCERITVTVTYPVPALSLPWIGGLGGGPTITATGVHSEIVDPFRSGLPVDDQLGGDCA